MECCVYTTGLGLSEAEEQHSTQLLVTALKPSLWAANSKAFELNDNKGMDVLLYGPMNLVSHSILPLQRKEGKGYCTGASFSRSATDHQPH